MRDKSCKVKSQTKFPSFVCYSDLEEVDQAEGTQARKKRKLSSGGWENAVQILAVQQQQQAELMMKQFTALQ